MELTADIILQIAIDMEQAGETFYNSLSQGSGHAEISALAASLAKAEREHIVTFKQMRDAILPHQRGQRLTEKELFETSHELRKKVIPDARTVFEAVQSSDLLKTLDMAIEMESQAVAFYISYATSLDNAVFTGIITEEKEHLKTLLEVRRLFSEAK